jgi:hypothetical protein
LLLDNSHPFFVVVVIAFGSDLVSFGCSRLQSPRSRLSALVGETLENRYFGDTVIREPLRLQGSMCPVLGFPERP